jgi:hypothetical protein
MASKPLGRLEKVDVRTIWDHEAHDFTPWLAREENLAQLGDAIGMEVELEGTEQDVGSFNADILCRDTVDDSRVLIENQLERTDHGHLGQLLMYAAGLDAVTVIWIARRFRDPHRAALDWLNEITHEDIRFFGIEIELWQIGESAVAPKFNLVSKPNDWSKTVSRTAKSQRDLTETQKLYLEYWSALSEYIDEHGERVKPRSPHPDNYADFAVGRSGCNLSATVSTRESQVQVHLWILGTEDSEALFRLLEEERSAIEGEIGVSLDWQPRPNKKSFVIAYRWDADPTDRDDWPNQHKRITELLDAFHKAFAPRLKRIDASTWTSTDEME